MEMFCNMLYEGLRSLVIHENDVDILCDVIKILRDEILIESVKPRGLTE